MSLVVRKPVFGVSDQVPHKPGCKATEDGYRHEIPCIGSRGIVLCSKNKGANQLCGYHEADLCLCFRICKKPVFLITRLILSLMSETPHLLGKSCLCGSALEDLFYNSSSVIKNSGLLGY